MRVPLLTRLRGTDGRSLAKALAVFLLLNAIVSGLHAGLAEAGPGEGVVICSLAASSADGGLPAETKDHRHDCCVVGSGFAPPLTASTVAAAWRQADDIRAPDYVALPPTRLVLAHEGPRGPPILI